MAQLQVTNPLSPAGSSQVTLTGQAHDLRLALGEGMADRREEAECVLEGISKARPQPLSILPQVSQTPIDCQ